MPSNADIIKSIAEVSAELDKDAPETEGKNNGELANILSALKAEKKAADEDHTPNAAANAAADEDHTPNAAANAAADEDHTPNAAANAAAEAKVEATAAAEANAAAEAKVEATAAAEANAEEEAKVKPPYYVADGKALTCKKGVLDSGDEVKAEYLGGGKDSLNALVKSGHVIKS